MRSSQSAGQSLVVGLGVTGKAVVRALRRRGEEVVATDDRPTEELRRFCDELGVVLAPPPDDEGAVRFVSRAERVLPTPGLPDAHPIMRAARRLGARIESELDLAREWDDRPLVAITGTNGKTTVTALVVEMICAGGRKAVGAGNENTPLVEAIEDPAVEVFVVEASSFRLAHTRLFTPRVATWLNFAPDHLDVHADLAAYEAAKARILADQERSATAVLNADDPVVSRHSGPARRLTFSPQRGDYRVLDGFLVTEERERILRVEELARRLPHDISNALAAAASARALGTDLAAIAAVLRSFTGLAHRVQLLGERDGVRYFDDSKATGPHAVAAAVSGFESVVLIAGGRSKGVDLAPLGDLSPHLRAVVAIGEAAGLLDELFSRQGVEVRRAASMTEAVLLAAELARPGDAVLLSPGCTSYDWYGGFAERGEDFSRCVAELGVRGGPQ